MKKIFAVILSISLIMGLAACAGKVEVPSKKDVQKEVEKEYDMDFKLDSKDIAEDGSEAEWVFISEDGSLQVTVSWSAKDPDEFDFDDKKLDVTGPEPTETGPLPTDVVQYDGPMVGVSMPTKDLQRWNQDGDYMMESGRRLYRDRAREPGLRSGSAVCRKRHLHAGISDREHGQFGL